jgi:hypothetical protein
MIKERLYDIEDARQELRRCHRVKRWLVAGVVLGVLAVTGAIAIPILVQAIGHGSRCAGNAAEHDGLIPLLWVAGILLVICFGPPAAVVALSEIGYRERMLRAAQCDYEQALDAE